MGDYTLAKPHSHGNAKSEKKKNENFVPTNNDCDNDKFSVSTISNLVGNKEFTLITPSCQKQTDRTSCEVFAIAFATSIALGLDPSTLVFEKEANMREHLKDCLNKRVLTAFPTTSNSRKLVSRLKVTTIPSVF